MVRLATLTAALAMAPAASYSTFINYQDGAAFNELSLKIHLKMLDLIKYIKIN